MMSDQRSTSCCTLSDGKHNNNTSNKKSRSKKSTRKANTPGYEMSGRPRYDEATSFRRREPKRDDFMYFKF